MSLHFFSTLSSKFVYFCFFFFFNDTATTEIYTLSLHDALPIWWPICPMATSARSNSRGPWRPDRKSTRLNSSHLVISYAVFCLKKKKQNDRSSRNKTITNRIYPSSTPRLKR